MAPRVTVDRLEARADRDALMPGIEAIFWETSAISTLASDAERAVFHERWLGRYLDHDPSFFYIASSPAGEVIGYLAGCLDDPATAPRFADLAYFQTFSRLTRRYPAHLHVNLTTSARGQGVGSTLIETFAADAARAGSPGVHVVTGQGMRNVGFYGRNGFREVGRAEWNGKVVLFLGRAL